MRPLNSSATRRVLAFAVLGLFLLYWIPFSHGLPGWVPFQFATSYRVYQASQIAMWTVVALGLNILTGYNGQISLGHSAFVALGGYTAAILMYDHSWPFWATIIVAGIFAGAAGFLVGIPALRLTGPYLAIATLALSLAAPQILLKYEGLTHGAQGINIQKPPPPPFLEGMLTQDQWLYFLALLIAILMTVLAWNIVRSRVGRALVAIRDSEVAAQAMGISVARYKTMAFGISAFYAGIAGGLYVQVVGFMSPFSFNVFHSINYLTAIVVGGLASILGSILGAIAFLLVPEIAVFMRDTLGMEVAEQAPWAIYGAALILVMIFMPYGIAGFLRRLGGLRPATLIQNLGNVYNRWLEALRGGLASAGQIRSTHDDRPKEKPPNREEEKGGDRR